MELFVALALLFIGFSMGAGFLAVGMALGYVLIVTSVLPWWVIVTGLAAWVWWLGGKAPE